MCRCHSNGLEELCTGCYQDTWRVDWFSWHGGYLDSLKEARGRVAWLQQDRDAVCTGYTGAQPL